MIKVRLEPPEYRGMPKENCVFCDEATRYWYGSGESPVCQPCAKTHKVSDIKDAEVKRLQKKLVHTRLSEQSSMGATTRKDVKTVEAELAAACQRRVELSVENRVTNLETECRLLREALQKLEAKMKPKKSRKPAKKTPRIGAPTARKAGPMKHRTAPRGGAKKKDWENE